MRQTTDQKHIGDHFCLRITMQGYLQTAGAEDSHQCDATTRETVSFYLVHV